MMGYRRPSESEVEQALAEWGRSVRETAEIRSWHVRIDRTRLLQAVLKPYRRWTWAFRWAIGLTAIWLGVVGIYYFYVLKDRGLHGVRKAEYAAGVEDGQEPILPTALRTGPEAPWPDGPVDPELSAQVHTLLMALRQPGRIACRDQADGLDFRLETEKVRQLYQTWALTVHRWDDPYGEVLRHLAVTLEPCLSAEQAQTLQAWSQDVNAYLYLAQPMGESAPMK